MKTLLTWDPSDPDVSVFQRVTISSADVKVASASSIRSFPAVSHYVNRPLSRQVHTAVSGGTCQRQFLTDTDNLLAGGTEPQWLCECAQLAWMNMHLCLVKQKPEGLILQNSQMIEWFMTPNPSVEIQMLLYLRLKCCTPHQAWIHRPVVLAWAPSTVRPCLVGKLDKIIFPPPTCRSANAYIPTRKTSKDSFYALAKTEPRFSIESSRSTDWPSSSPIFSCKLFWYIRRLFSAQHAAS